MLDTDHVGARLQMGAKTGLAGFITGLLILCTLLFLTSLFK